QRLGIDRVMDSRTAEFGARVMRDTNGAGVDVVLNSLTGEAIGAGFDALAPNGRFLEIGKREVWDDEAVRERRNDVRYEVVDLLAHAAANPGDIRQIFEHLLSGFEHGDFEPLPRQVFPIESARAAFAQLERAQHIGKVVLDFDHTPHLHADASYLITGAFGGLGRATSQWLAGCGAGHLILIGRNLPAADDPFLADLQQRGISVECHALDVCDRDRLKQVIGNTISQTASRPPLRGVIHAAGILDDAPVEALDWPRLNEVLKSKVQGALNLHQLTLKLSLDFFILYSSASALLGSPGQGSHVAANSFLDALARERRQLGLPALSVAWGPWTDIGAVAAPAVHAQLHSQGIGSIKPTAGFAALARLMSSPHTCYRAVVPLDWPTFARRGAGRDPFLAAAAGAAETMGVDHEIGVTGGDWCAELAAVPARRRQQVLTAKIQIELARVLGLAKNQAIDEHAPFFDLGVDSLMSVELKTLLERALGLEIEPTLLFEKPNIATLSEALLAMLDGDNVFSQYKSSATVNLATGKASASPGGDIGAELEALEALLDKP
ncbi:MAG: SDR family NAD(P)-dependent oxidoreductase, partial [Pseudomonadota bacterium]